jgi:hypothetical protein
MTALVLFRIYLSRLWLLPPCPLAQLTHQLQCTESVTSLRFYYQSVSLPAAAVVRTPKINVWLS